MRRFAWPSLLALGLLACGKGGNATDGSANVVAARAFADLQIPLAEGWTSTYDATTDTVQLTSAKGTVRLEQADDRHVASGDAYMSHLAPRWKGRLVTIEDRGNVRTAGFALKLGVYTGENDPKPLHVTVVVGKLGRIWYHCLGEGIEDEAVHQEVIAMCRAIVR